MINQLILSWLFFVFWLFHILRRELFLIFFLQKKEYRLDRFLEEVKRKKEIIFSKYFYLGLIFLLLLFVFRALGQWAIWFLYLFLALYSLYLFFKKSWKFPQFTVKVILWFGLVVFLNIFLFFVFESVLFVLVLEILLPLFLYLTLQLVQFLVFFAKKRLIRKAKIKRADLKNLKVIGITGSYAKTTTKEILFAILAQKYNVLKTEEHVNTEMGVAKTVLKKLNKGVDYFICEMGAYKKGEIKAICEIVKPEIGILTGINEQHLALFGSQQNIIQGKYELIESLPENGLAIFNGENKYCLDLFERTEKRKLLYSYNDVEDIRVSKNGSRFILDGVVFETKLLGKHNVLNILGAVKLAQELGVSLEKCAETGRELEQELGGMVLKTSAGGVKIIDSSYSSNPDGVISTLDYLGLWQGKKAIITPGLIELGSASKEVHQRIEKKILEVCDVAIATTKGVFENIEFIASPKQIIEKLKNVDVVLIEGRVPEQLLSCLVE